MPSYTISSIFSPTADFVSHLFLLSQNLWPDFSSTCLSTFITALFPPSGWFLLLMLHTSRILAHPNLFFTSLPPPPSLLKFLPPSQDLVEADLPLLLCTHLPLPHKVYMQTRQRVHLLNCPKALVAGDVFSSGEGIKRACLLMPASGSRPHTALWIVWARPGTSLQWFQPGCSEPSLPVYEWLLR